MPSVQIKDVPPAVHAELVRRAKAAGQSLQEFLLARLTAEASRVQVADVLERINNRSGGRVSPDDAARAVRATRR